MEITIDEFVVFCERTIDEMATAVGRLDDEQVNAVPDLPGPNSPYVLVNHALGACEWWTAHIVCGHPSERDRPAEFDASGTVAEIVAATETAKARLRGLVPEMNAATELQFEAATRLPLKTKWTVGAALMHTYEELAQHLGHLEITVDLVVQATGSKGTL